MIFFSQRVLSLLKICLITIFIAITTIISAQELGSKTSDSLRLKSPQELARLIIVSDSVNYEMYEKVLENLQDNDIATGLVYKELAYFFFRKEDFKKTFEYSDKLLKIGEKLENDELIFGSLLLKGASFLRQGYHEKAFDYYEKMLQIAKEQGNLENEIIANSGLILVLQKMNKLDLALELSKETLTLINNSSFKNSINHAKILTNINEVYLSKEQYDSVIFYSEKGIAISKSLDFKEGLVDLYIKMGIVFYNKRDYPNAFEYLQNAEGLLQNYQINNNVFPIVKVNYYKASCYFEQDKLDDAIASLCRTMDFIDTDDLGKLPVIQSYLLLANCYFEKKDFEQAHYWENQYLQLNEMHQEDKNKTVDKIYERETSKYEHQIAQLKKKESRMNNVLIGAVIFLFGFILIGFRYYQKQQKNRAVFSELVEKVNVLEINKPKNESSLKNTPIVINDDTVKDVLRRLDKLEQQEYFLKMECNLSNTAKKVKTNTTYLTKIIHAHKNKNFNEYLTDLRIEYALQRIKNDAKFRAFSVKSIAAEVGYKSDDAFAKRFKAKTGLNPSYYIKNIGKLSKNNDDSNNA
ncbi:helix-turn-helix transcriptional regulator [Aquimarina litoralis]|uniref:helix-turn-helix transcriptional regulator n=1 Tax=Aquimarina litoralis TaxID=584605 RepID=UPI001C56182A|nr:helix-turn-helix transcriptional regulator [Aquimarina litoralis]MBW1294126.1 helix-turn-helix domain-containing protein [Aquimarina litoralis]